MGRKIFAVSWIWMALAFAYFISTSSTQLNATHQSYTKYGHEPNSTLPADSELSGSERTRRLIPYMAFYLPPSAIPVNQQYSLQTPQQQNRYSSNSSEHQPSTSTVIESAGPVPPPGYIAVPSYFYTSAVEGRTSNAATKFQTVNYENSNNPNKNSGPLLHLLPPGSAEPMGETTPFVFVRERHPSKHKTVQHFPPLQQDNNVKHLQEQSYQQQPQGKQIWYPQQLKSSKFNFTPFTSSNTLPGKFVPVFYSSLSSAGGGGGVKTKTINYNYDEKPEELMHQLQQIKEQQSYESSYKEMQQNNHHQAIAEQIPLPPSPDETSSAKEAQQEPHIEFIAIGGLTGPSAESAPSTQSGPAYHIVKDNTPSTAFSPISPHHQSLNSLKVPQQLQYRPSKHPHYHHTPRPDSTFPNEQRQHEARHHQQAQHPPPPPQQQQYFNANELTPQEKYVLFLRQRMHYNKQRQKQKLYPPTAIKDTKQYSTGVLEYEQLQQQQPPPSHSQANTNIPVDIESVQLHHQSPQQENYHRHSPVPHHAVYLRPQLAVPGNHQPTQKPFQHVLQIPVQKLLSEMESLPKTNPNKLLSQQPHRFRVKQQSKYIDAYGNPNSQYADHEEPNQALEEQYPHNIVPNRQLETNSIPPPTYIVLTTSKPPFLEDTPAEQHQYPHHHYPAATQRPIYQHSPTLRLQPITAEVGKYAYVTKRPTQSLYPTATPPTPIIKHITTKQYKIKYIPTTPRYNQMTPFIATKLRPAIEYEENDYNRPSMHHRQVPTPPTLPENYALDDPNQLPDIHTLSLADILHKLQASNHLPETLTADNIDNSIKTLINILNNLKKTKKIIPNPSQHHEPPTVPSDYDYSNGHNNDNQNEEHDLSLLPAPPLATGPNKHPGPSTGRAGIDYPIYSEIPQTSFKCNSQRYKGFFGDPETNCQVWHYCDLNGGKASFLCPNGTIFSQIALTCDWWFNVKCSTTAQLYVLNERLYKYILPFNPKFPEDYSGPLVDKYLAMKFEEMEEKMRLEKDKLKVKTVQEENHIEETITTTTTLSQESSISTEKLEKPQHQNISEQSSERNLLTDDISEDIAQKAIYESTTKQATTTQEYENAPDSFALNPIVVTSSTVKPEDSEEEISSTNEEQENANIAGDQNEHWTYERSESNEKHKTKQHQKRKEQGDLPPKIDVEKLEVIEIKSDKSSGHLTPDVFFAGSNSS